MPSQNIVDHCSSDIRFSFDSHFSSTETPIFENNIPDIAPTFENNIPDVTLAEENFVAFSSDVVLDGNVTSVEAVPEPRPTTSTKKLPTALHALGYTRKSQLTANERILADIISKYSKLVDGNRRREMDLKQKINQAKQFWNSEEFLKLSPLCRKLLMMQLANAG